MRTSLRLTLLAAAALAGALVACSFDNGITYPELTTEDFNAVLNGANEVPAVTTTATGTAQFALFEDSILAFRVDVAGLDSTTMSHIHDGAAGVGGPILVTLADYRTVACKNAAGANINVSNPRCRPGLTGAIALGQVRASQMDTVAMHDWGTTQQERFDSLVVRIRNGTVYVNVHNVANPAGHIRGQTQPMP